jgi:ABC-type glutathione transport system ATPase component
MKLTDVEKAAIVCRDSKSATLCLVGVSGSGKTSIWGQIYEELGFEGYVIMRPSLLADAADLVGLPEFELVESGGKVTKTTTFTIRIISRLHSNERNEFETILLNSIKNTSG